MNSFSKVHNLSIAGILALLGLQWVDARDISTEQLPDLWTKIVTYAKKKHSENDFIMRVANELQAVLDWKETDQEKAKKIKEIVDKKIVEFDSLRFEQKKEIHSVFQGIAEVAYGAAEQLLKTPETKKLQNTTAGKVADTTAGNTINPPTPETVPLVILDVLDRHLWVIEEKLNTWKDDPRMKNFSELEKAVQWAQKLMEQWLEHEKNTEETLLKKHRQTLLEIGETNMAVYRGIAEYYELSIQQALQDSRHIYDLNDLEAKKTAEAKEKIKDLEAQKAFVQESCQRHLEFLSKNGQKVTPIRTPALNLYIEKLHTIIQKSEKQRNEWQRILDELARSIDGPSADFDRAIAQMKINSLNSLLITYFPEREEFLEKIVELYDDSDTWVLSDSEKKALYTQIEQEKMAFRSLDNTEFDSIFDALATKVESAVSKETVQEVGGVTIGLAALASILLILKRIRRRKPSTTPHVILSPLPVALTSEKVTADIPKNNSDLEAKSKRVDEIFRIQTGRLMTKEEAGIVVEYLQTLEWDASTNFEISKLAHDILHGEDPRGFETLAKILKWREKAVSCIKFFQSAVSMYKANNFSPTEPATESSHE